MNNSRRKEIAAAQDRLADVMSMADSIKEELDNIKSEEEEYLENMPESLQSGERGENAQAAIDALDEVIGVLDDLIGSGSEDRLSDAQN